MVDRIEKILNSNPSEQYFFGSLIKIGSSPKSIQHTILGTLMKKIENHYTGIKTAVATQLYEIKSHKPG